MATFWCVAQWLRLLAQHSNFSTTMLDGRLWWNCAQTVMLTPADIGDPLTSHLQRHHHFNSQSHHGEPLVLFDQTVLTSGNIWFGFLKVQLNCFLGLDCVNWNMVTTTWDFFYQAHLHSCTSSIFFVPLCVCVCTKYLKNTWTDFHQTWWQYYLG